MFKNFLRLTLLGLIAMQLAVFSARLHWFLELFTHYPHYYAIAASSILPFLIWKRMDNSTIIATVIIAINLATFAPYLETSKTIPIPPPPTCSGFHSEVECPHQNNNEILTILASNFYYKNTHFEEVGPMLKNANPDIFMIHEASDYWWAGPKAPFANSHPYQYKTEESGVAGIFMGSKIPGTYTEIPLGKKFALEFKPEGYDLKILAVHPPAPINSSYAEERNLQFEDIAAYVQKNDLPVIIMGDFNCTPWSPYFQDLLASTMLQDARLAGPNGKSFGFIATWHAHNPFFKTPIDHALVSPEISVSNFTTTEEIASDHRPILLQISQ